MYNLAVEITVVLVYIALALGLVKAVSVYISSFIARRRALSPQEALAKHFADSLGCQVRFSEDGKQVFLQPNG